METYTTSKGTVLPIIRLKGKPYLQVAHRIVWFREEHPEGQISTELTLQAEACMTEAKIYNGEGKLLSNAHKVEHKSHFGDFIEKSETGAIGRALALCGYGTQFTEDIDESDRIVDSPVTQKNAPQAKNHTPAIPNHAPQGNTSESFTKGKYAGKSFESVGRKDVQSWLEYMKEKGFNKGADFKNCEAWLKKQDNV